MRVSVGVPKYYFGKGALSQLSSVLQHTPHKGSTVLYIIDHFFRNNHDFLSQLPICTEDDVVIFYDSTHEPSTEDVDFILADLQKAGKGETVKAVVGIGGGAALDVAKAVSNLLTNTGRAEDYQGWDLVRIPGIFKIGVPTISGTGAEASRTCVLMNKKKNLKLGMNSEFSVFDFLILDPNLLATIPKEQFFFTAMDTYIHCVESLRGSYRHEVADAYSREALRIIKEVFESKNLMDFQNFSKVMAASYLGGCAIGNSYVGVVHPFSAGLSMVFHLHHCYANCVVMNVMDEFYLEEVVEFRRYIKKHEINLGEKICSNLSKNEKSKLYEATIVHEKPLMNALGENFLKTLPFDKVMSIFEKM